MAGRAAFFFFKVNLSLSLFLKNIYLFYLFIFLIYLFIFLAALGLSCSTQDLFVACGIFFVRARGLLRFLSSCGVGARAHGLCSLWHVGSLVEARELSSCGAWA